MKDETTIDDGFQKTKTTTIRSNGGSSRGKLLLPIVALVIVLAMGFVGGMQYQKSHGSTTASSRLASANQPGGMSGYGGGMGGRQGRGGFGTVTAISDSSITVQNSRTNATTSYTITSNTTVSNAGSTASLSDIKVGDTVIVRTSTTATSTATEIMDNPSFGGAGGPGMGAGSSSSSTDDSSGASTTNSSSI